MAAFLFNHTARQLYELYPIDNDDVEEYRHTFGGAACHEGAIPPDFKTPIHLFYLLVLADPRVGLQFPQRRLKHLPLYYPLGNCGGPFHYRVVSNARIEMFSQPYPKEHRAALPRRPKTFKRTAVELGPMNYDPTDPRDVWGYAGLFGIDMLAAPQKAKLRVDMDEWLKKNLPHRSLLEDYELDDGDEEPPLEELVASYCPFTQGMPEAVCPNTACAWYGTEKKLPVLAYVEPEEDDPFYQSLAGADSGQLIWSVCPNCASISVENPCT